MSLEPSPMRLAAPPDVVAEPLVAGLDLSPWKERVRLVREKDPDAALARLLDGELDAALLPPDRLATKADRLEIVPGLGISTYGAGPVVRLEHDGPLESVEALKGSDRFASSALARLMFAASGRPGLSLKDCGRERVFRASDGSLLSGDEALASPVREGSVDLGEAWSELTGKPFVWCCWCARAGAVDRERYRLLHAVRTRARDLRDRIASQAGDRLALEEAERECASNLLGAVRYRFGRDELAAVRTFWKEGDRHGLFRVESEPRFVPIARGSDCWSFSPPPSRD